MATAENDDRLEWDRREGFVYDEGRFTAIDDIWNTRVSALSSYFTIMDEVFT